MSRKLNFQISMSMSCKEGNRKCYGGVIHKCRSWWRIAATMRVMEMVSMMGEIMSGDLKMMHLSILCMEDHLQMMLLGGVKCERLSSHGTMIGKV